MSAETLLPASRFEVRPLRDMAVIFGNSFLPLYGFGIYDLEAKGWVCLSKPRKTTAGGLVFVPYHLKRKYVVQEAISGGLWSGYEVVDPKVVTTQREALASLPIWKGKAHA